MHGQRRHQSAAFPAPILSRQVSHSEIGDHVHTGSHNVFVAPVRIGEGAKTGAGAVIRKDVPAGALALSVAPQRNVEGWVETNRPGTAAADAAARSRSAQKADDGAQEQDG